MARKVICNHCGQPARLVNGAYIYGRRPDLAHHNFWLCAPCGAYVGCHKKYGDKTQPLGLLAKADERKWRWIAHKYFDPIWKTGEMSRSAAYHWLADRMKMPVQDCHIGLFNVEQCKKVYEICTGNAPEFAMAAR